MAPISAFSACRRRAAHSATTRRHPRKPSCLSCRHNSAPLRRPAARVEPGKVDFERTLSNAENVVSLTARDFAREATAIPSAAHNIFDRHPIPGQSDNDSVGFLSPEGAVHVATRRAKRRGEKMPREGGARLFAELRILLANLARGGHLIWPFAGTSGLADSVSPRKWPKTRPSPAPAQNRR